MSTEKSVPSRLWRQGDILIREYGVLPAGCQPCVTRIIAQGEATGHAHKLQGPRSSATLFYTVASDLRRFRNSWVEGMFYLQVTGPKCAIVHPEHGPIPLGPGNYLIWRQREHNPRTGLPRVAGD